jgi:programmed cell death 6-interacting protein
MAIVKATIPQEAEFAIPRWHQVQEVWEWPLFERMLPYAVHLAISLYDDRKDTFVREQIVAKKDDLDQVSTR